jgi:hypothetical protein
MGTLTCRCGHSIKTDNEGTESYSASLMPATSWGKLQQAVLANLHSLVTAIQQGKTAAQWANAAMSYQPGEDALLLYQFFEDPFFDLGRSMYQCEKCSRIFVETSTPNSFRTFQPDSDDSQAILADGE